MTRGRESVILSLLHQEKGKVNQMQDLMKLVKETPYSELKEMVTNARINVRAGSKSWNDRVLASLSLYEPSDNKEKGLA